MTQPRPWEVQGTRELPPWLQEWIKRHADIFVPIARDALDQEPEPTWKDITSSDTP